MTNPGNTAAAVGSSQKKWARKELEIPRGSDSTEQLLQRLADQEFILSDSQREALNLLLGRPYRVEGRWGPKRTAYATARQSAIDSEISKFAAEFFRLSVESRKERWNKLQSRNGMTPPQQLRLKSLKAGLHVEIPKAKQHGGEHIQHEIVVVICDLFVLGPAAKSQHRAAFLKRIHRNEHRWSDAASQLKQRFPDVARLLPSFTKELIALNGSSRAAARRLNERRRGSSRTTLPVIRSRNWHRSLRVPEWVG